METKSCKNVAFKHMCILCDYNTSRKSSIDKHFLTDKHNQCVLGDFGDTQKVAKGCKQNQDKPYNCDKCSKIYISRNGLWKHKQLCVGETADAKPNEESDKSLMSFLIKQNQEFKDMIVEQNKTIVDAIKKCSSSISNSTVNSHNKTFNLQVFLNEDCKDAMNITDFVNSINLQLSDLESVGQLGYVEGISNIIIKNLKALDVTKRPVHCTDPKRETIYIKDGDVWEKDEDDNKKLRKMIRSVAFRNCKNTRLFKEKYPECMDGDSKYSDIYNKIIIEVMGGDPKSNDIEKQNKIIRKIAKQMTIDKS